MITQSDNAQEFLNYTLGIILENPDAISIKQIVDDLGTLYELQVASSDMGRLIGKEGKTIQSIRTLLRMIGSQNNERINLKVLEPVS